MDSCKTFNDFFFKSEAEKPSWMSGDAPTSHAGEHGEVEEEERLLDDAYSRYISRAVSMDSRFGSSMESSQGSELNDHDMEPEAQVALRVAMCCGKCEAKAKSLTQLEGVTSVMCDRNAERVTVAGSARPRDILEACQKLFPQAKLWSPDDALAHPTPAAPPP